MAEHETPSFLTSTFSLVTLMTVLGYVLLCVWTKNVDALKDVTLMVLGVYSGKKMFEMSIEQQQQSQSVIKEERTQPTESKT